MESNPPQTNFEEPKSVNKLYLFFTAITSCIVFVGAAFLLSFIGEEELTTTALPETTNKPVSNKPLVTTTTSSPSTTEKDTTTVEPSSPSTVSSTAPSTTKLASTTAATEATETSLIESTDPNEPQAVDETGTDSRALTPANGRGLLTPDELYKLRFCESTDRYTITNPTGKYRGAYQFSQATWDGTAKWAGWTDLVGKRPETVAPADQDAMARALYIWRGKGQWPTCGRSLSS